MKSRLLRDYCEKLEVNHLVSIRQVTSVHLLERRTTARPIFAERQDYKQYVKKEEGREGACLPLPKCKR